MMSIAPNAINTTGRGSSGVGLTAAVVVDKDTGERHLEAGAMVLGDRGIVCIDEFDKMNEVDRVAIHEVMEQQTVTIAKAGIHVSLNARCSVLAAANPIYGEYQRELSANKNIALPDSLLSRFDLLFIVLDEHTEKRDRKVAERVIQNHKNPIDTVSTMSSYNEKIIEPEIHTDDVQNTEIFEKSHRNSNSNSNIKKEVLTRSFLRKYLHYVKKSTTPVLTNEASIYISEKWTELRGLTEGDDHNRPVPITVRTLETLIRLATAHAKLRQVKAVSEEDAQVAYEMLTFAINQVVLTTEGYTLSDEEDIEMEEEEAEQVKVKSAKSVNQDKGKKSAGKSSRNKGMIAEESEEDQSESHDTGNQIHASGKKSKAKSGADIKEVDQLFDAVNIKQGPVNEEQTRFVYKAIFEYTKSKKIENISLDELWEICKANPDSRAIHKIKSKSDVLDIVMKLDNENKVMYAAQESQIFII